MLLATSKNLPHLCCIPQKYLMSDITVTFPILPESESVIGNEYKRK